ncbi:hypothetical protein EII12_10935 [Buchananella hordeovulneris]|nr:hypothetical protein EII12_10935 [Buchananella hordeovulneris]
MWKEIPEPILAPEAQAQAGFAEAELAAKYFVELQYYVAQTNDLATWEQVVSSDSAYGKNVAQKSENRRKHRVRASYEKVQVDAVKALQGSEDNSVFKVLCEVSILAESAVNENGEIVESYGDSNYYIVAFVRFSEGSWTFLEGDSFDEIPEGF